VNDDYPGLHAGRATSHVVGLLFGPEWLLVGPMAGGFP